MGGRGRKEPKGVSGRFRTGRLDGGGGAVSGVAVALVTSSKDGTRVRLYSRQHAGQRHSTRVPPSLAFERDSRQPNWALMSV
jgi:hypothetical protein